MSKETNKVEEKEYSKIQIFFLLVFIPILFTIAILFAVLTVAGVDVTTKVMEIVKSEAFTEETEENQKRSVKEQQQQVQSLQSELKDKEEAIQSYEEQVAMMGRKNDELQIEIRDLQEELDDMQEQRANKEVEMTDLISTYEEMTPKRAALIVAELDEEQAMLLLSHLKSKTRSSILEKMPPEIAAKYTNLLVQSSEDSQ
ncbi:MotE family protein [Metabacillus iocasae]|uniref:Flagellar motility protein MotE (MotC chaperone) n=1 Tax=Priestia iocasae TaxID=2291674 RepID=A0ABS2QRM9_9BACI|nr:hypothetical protein [Metabacillus iocasae]MBM7701868.1 flagellar motility protein MotE (MotC chaperone) [Metabacillus iocasae]